jgi:hypothetical protein
MSATEQGAGEGMTMNRREFFARMLGLAAGLMGFSAAGTMSAQTTCRRRPSALLRLRFMTQAQRRHAPLQKGPTMTRREREDRERRYEESKKRVREAERLDEEDPRALPAIPSQYGIQSLADRLASGPELDEVYLHCRESALKQHLPLQVKGARRRTEAVGVKVRHCFGEVGNGKSLEPDERVPGRLWPSSRRLWSWQRGWSCSR